MGVCGFPRSLSVAVLLGGLGICKMGSMSDPNRSFPDQPLVFKMSSLRGNIDANGSSHNFCVRIGLAIRVDICGRERPAIAERPRASLSYTAVRRHPHDAVDAVLQYERQRDPCPGELSAWRVRPLHTSVRPKLHSETINLHEVEWPGIARSLQQSPQLRTVNALSPRGWPTMIRCHQLILLIKSSYCPAMSRTHAI